MCCVQMCCKSRRSKSIEIDIGNQSISIDLIRRLISEIDRNRSQKKIIYRLLSIFVIVNDNKRSSNPEVNILNMTIFDFSNYTRSPQLVQILVSFVSWFVFFLYMSIFHLAISLTLKSNSIAHFTVTVGNEAGVDLVLIQPFLLYYANHFVMLSSIFLKQNFHLFEKGKRFV